MTPAALQALRTPDGSRLASSDQVEFEQRYLGLLELTGAAVLLVCESRIVFASERACTLLGIDAAGLLALRFEDCIAPQDREALGLRMQALAIPGQSSAFAECRLLKANGATVDAGIALHAGRFLGEPAMQVVLRDATDDPSLRAQVARLERYDPLTELPNRRQFLDQLEGAVARAARNRLLLGVLCIGIDHFRGLNEALGQRGGDAVLMQASARLKQVVRKSDTLARTGGDEFSVILEGLVEREGAAIAAQRELDSLARPFLVDGTEVRLTVSIGAAIYPLDAPDSEALLRNASMAMRYAKRQGRNRYEFHSTQIGSEERSTSRRRVEIALYLKSLTPREREVLDLMIEGKASKVIAISLGISARTIDIHRARVMEKMRADSLATLVSRMREWQA